MTGETAGRMRDLGRKALRPPLREHRFWAVQAVVVALVAGHFAVDVLSSPTTAIPAGIPVALLLVPVSYAALHYGLAGSASTAGWATLLWLPDLLLPGDRGHAGNDVIELALVLAVAVFVGRHMDVEQAERAQAHRFAGMLLTVQEEEQRRIAQEIHDEPLQLLVHLARSLDEAAEAEGVGPELSSTLSQARNEVLEVSGRLRAVVRGLRPPALDKFGLVPALRGLVAGLDGEVGPSGLLDAGAGSCRLPASVELGIFRIAQEAINNALLHADARHIEVSFHQSEGEVSLRVADDGHGFDQETLRRAGSADSFGLLGMRERAELMGARLRVSSGPEHGTVVELHLTCATTPGAPPVPAETGRNDNRLSAAARG